MAQDQATRDHTSSLASLLALHREGLAEAWTEAVFQQMPSSRYAQMPREELVALSLAAYSTATELLNDGPNPSWPATGILSPKYLLGSGFDITEVVYAVLLSLEVNLNPLRPVSCPDPVVAERAFAESSVQLRGFLAAFVAELAAEARRQVEEEQERTATVLKAARAANSTLSLAEVLRRAEDALSLAAGASGCWFYLMHRAGAAGGRWVDFGGEEGRASFPDEPSTRFLTRVVLDEKKPFVCVDVQPALPVGAEWLQRWGTKSVLAVPMRMDGPVLGVAVAWSRDQRCQFTPRQVDLVQAVADVVTPAIENARLYRKVEKIAVMEERARLSRELHDDLAQLLGCLSLSIASTRDLMASGRRGPVEAALAEMARTTEEVYRDLREAIFCLRASVPSGPEFGPALRQYLTDYETHYGVKVELSGELDPSIGFSPTVATQLSRIVLEALANVRKHSGVDRARVCVEREVEQLRVSIEDEGRGFDVATLDEPGGAGVGLEVMRERAESVRGSLEVDSLPSRGTRITVHVPLVHTEASV